MRVVDIFTLNKSFVDGIFHRSTHPSSGKFRAKDRGGDGQVDLIGVFPTIFFFLRAQSGASWMT
jgi:hypothetical protein